MRSDDPATRTKWLPHAMVGAVSGMVGELDRSLCDVDRQAR